ncbi:hypothetical protein BKA61DRAFT_571560 [Leptodontidium sp. MPI-SDFR-AT-0119]|nr:hypothetical protein BKA61DRAFT_571560 [Leptodontidium sp. MPI-SDFR-AT-0119]
MGIDLRASQEKKTVILKKKSIPTIAAPDCSLTCLGTLIPQYCDSLTDTTCICTNTDLAAVLLACAISACNITDSLQLARYQAEVCDVPNDMTRYWLQIHTYCVLVPVTTIFVALRIFARTTDLLGSDDWVLLLTFAFYLCMTSTATSGKGLEIHGVWTNWIYKVPPIKYINVFAAVYVAAGMSIIHNITILSMPIPTLMGLNLGMRKKANLMVMFSVGSFVVVASVLRLPSLIKMGNSSDPSCFYFPYLQMSLNSTSNNGHKTPNYANTTSLNTKEYFSKKRATQESFLELDDRSRTGSEEALQGKNNKPKPALNLKKSATRKSSDSNHDDRDRDSILHISTNSQTPI